MRSDEQSFPASTSTRYLLLCDVSISDRIRNILLRVSFFIINNYGVRPDIYDAKLGDRRDRDFCRSRNPPSRLIIVGTVNRWGQGARRSKASRIARTRARIRETERRP